MASTSLQAQIVLNESTLGTLQSLADNRHSLMRTYLPLSTHEDLRTFEMKLNDFTFRDKIARELSFHGEKNFNKTVTEICRQLFTDDLAHDFSWKGQRNNKMPMENLLIVDLIIDVVIMKGFRHKLRSSIIYVIKEWLAQANNRLKRRQTKYLRFDASGAAANMVQQYPSIQD